MNQKINVYQLVTDKIVAQLQQGIIPWQMPWKSNANPNLAMNYVTRKTYSFLNQFLLGWRGGEYVTFNQTQQLGGKIKKGSKAQMVVFFTMQTYKTKRKVKDTQESEIREEEVEISIPVLRYYNVFHIADCEGIESKLEEKEEPKETQLEPIESAEKIINDYVSREKDFGFRNNVFSNHAFYSPAEDIVTVPMLSQYKISEEYYSTAFHELVHSTGHPKRLNREDNKKVAAFGSDDYSREELVAEIGSAMLCSYCGIDCEKAFTNSVAYIQGWLSILKNDNRMIVWASSRAEKACDYILGKNE